MPDRASPPWLKPLFTWRSAIAESDLKPATKHVGLTLSLHMSERGDSCFPGKPLLSAETGYDVRTVDRALKELSEKRWLDVKKGGGRGRANHYFAKIPRSFPRASYFVEAEEDKEKPRHDAGDNGEDLAKPRHEAGVRDLNGGTGAETPAQDTVNPGMTPGEDVSSSTKSKGARATETKAPRVELPIYPTMTFKGQPLKYLWRELWDKLASSGGIGVRFELPSGLKVDATTIEHPDAATRRSRVVIIFREKSFSDYKPGDLGKAMKGFEDEKKTFWAHVFAGNGLLKADWIEGPASLYPSFHTRWRERWPVEYVVNEKPAETEVPK